MSETPEQPRITLEDGTDQEPPSSSTTDMSESQNTSESAQKEEGGSWYGKPENMGNAAGEWVQDKLQPVGGVAGKGLETVGKPIGGLVDPLVGGVMRSGGAWGDEMGVGYGNKDGGPAQAAEAEGERMKQQTGGEEQNAANPLGLNKKA